MKTSEELVTTSSVSTYSIYERILEQILIKMLPKIRRKKTQTKTLSGKWESTYFVDVNAM